MVKRNLVSCCAAESSLTSFFTSFRMATYGELVTFLCQKNARARVLNINIHSSCFVVADYASHILLKKTTDVMSVRRIVDNTTHRGLQ